MVLPPRLGSESNGGITVWRLIRDDSQNGAARRDQEALLAAPKGCWLRVDQEDIWPPISPVFSRVSGEQCVRMACPDIPKLIGIGATGQGGCNKASRYPRSSDGLRAEFAIHGCDFTFPDWNQAIEMRGFFGSQPSHQGAPPERRASAFGRPKNQIFLPTIFLPFLAWTRERWSKIKTQNNCNRC